DKDYVENGEQRMDLYRRMAAIRSKADADELLDEIVDRYGDPPKGVMNLIDVALLRARAARLAITDISQKGPDVLFTLLALDFEAVSRLCQTPPFPGRLFVLPKGKPTLRLRLNKGENSLKLAVRLVEALEAIVDEKNSKKP
ncbi:MAG: transcription-repair coupling factor, partial [Oscillospiraceae bacterium]|nr:transcription-repair coupling factor [Oscillospiraceae bacterium]